MTGEQFVTIERARFELWARGNGYCVDTDACSYIERDTLLAWTAWLAAKTEAMKEGGSKC